MKIRLLGALVGLAISFALPTFAQQKDTADARIAQQRDLVGDPKALDEFGSLATQQSEAFTNKDAAAVAALFTEDAVFLTDTGPLYGPQAVEKQYAEWFKGWHHSNHISKRDPNTTHIIGTADNIALSAEWSETNQAQGEQPFQLKGYWLAIDTRVGDAWKIRMLTYNVTPAPAATPSPTASPSGQ